MDDHPTRRGGSVLPSDADISILVLGEQAIGKSHMIQAYIGNRIPTAAEVPPVHPVYRMTPAIETASANLNVRPPSGNTRVIIDTDGVKLGASADAIKDAVVKYKPDVIVLCYSHADPMSLVDQLSDGGLPAWLAAHRAATMELKQSYEGEPDSNPFASDDILNGHVDENELSSVELRDRIVENLMIGHTNVLATINLSATNPTHEGGVVGEIGEVWDRAVDQVLHPVFPLFNSADTALTDDAAMAFSRIFRIVDRDGDGLLAVDEFSTWETLAFGVRVKEEDVRALFERIATEIPEGGVTEDASCLTEVGFRHVMVSYLFGMAADSVWTVLHAFEYRWGVPPAPHGRLSLELGHKAQEFVSGRTANGTAGPAGSPSSSAASPSGSSPRPHAKRLYLAMPDSFVSAEARSPDSSLVLSGTARHKYTDGVPLDTLTRSQLRRTGLGFVASLFKRFSTNGRKLSSDDLSRIFEVTPSRSHPFGSLYPEVTTHGHDGSLGLASWINMWQMLLTCKPATGLASLYHLGFHTPDTRGGGVSYTSLNYDPTAAVEDAGPRRTGGDLHPSPVRRVFVIGSAGSGKTSLIMHYLNGPGSLRDRTAALSTFSRDDRPGPHATNTVTHYVAEGCLPEDADPAMLDACPAAVIITEWPSATPVETIMSQAEHQADAILITVDPALPSSVAYFRRAVERIPDEVPTAVVATAHERDKSAIATGFTVLSAMCSQQPTVNLTAVNGSPEAVAAFLSNVAAAQAKLEEGTAPSSLYAAEIRADSPTAGGRSQGSQGVQAGAAVMPGLCLEVFKFGTRSPHSATVELFKYVTALALRHGLDNPQTASRRSRERLRAVLRMASRAGLAAAVLAVAAGVGMYLVDYRGTRGRVDGALASVRDKLPWPLKPSAAKPVQPVKMQ